MEGGLVGAPPEGGKGADGADCCRESIGSRGETERTVPATNQPGKKKKV